MNIKEQIEKKRPQRNVPKDEDAIDMTSDEIAPNVKNVYEQLLKASSFEDIAEIARSAKPPLAYEKRENRNKAGTLIHESVFLYCKQWEPSTCNCPVAFKVNLLKEKDGHYAILGFGAHHSELEEDKDNLKPVRCPKLALLEQRMIQKGLTKSDLMKKCEDGKTYLINEGIEDGDIVFNYNDIYRMNNTTKRAKEEKLEIERKEKAREAIQRRIKENQERIRQENFDRLSKECQEFQQRERDYKKALLGYTFNDWYVKKNDILEGIKKLKKENIQFRKENEELKRKQSLLQKKLKEAVYQERPKIKKHSIRYMGDDDDD